MPGFLFPGGPGGDDEPLLDMIFDGRSLPPRAPQEMHDLARMLATAAGPAEEPSELAGEAAALAAYTRSASPAGVLPASGPTRHRRARRRWSRRRWARRSLGTPAGRVRLATAVVAVFAVLSGAAVFTGVLQQVAHVTVSALAASTGVHKSSRTVSRPQSPTHHAISTAPQPALPPGTDHATSKPKAGPSAAPPTRGHRSRTPGCTPWPTQSPRPWNSPPSPAPTGQPQLKRCPATPLPMPTPSRQVTVAPSTGLATLANPAAPKAGPAASPQSSPIPQP